VGTRRFRGSLARSSVIAIVLLSMAAGVAASNSNRLRANLRGTNEVEAMVVDLDSRGRAFVRIDVDEGEVCFDVSYVRGGTPNRGHIHVGAAGINGAIVVTFFELAAFPADPRNDQLERAQRLRDCVDADPVVLAAIKANPAGYYVNLHNARFPGGFLRGQLHAISGD
jgi:hypothetical protein